MAPVAGLVSDSHGLYGGAGDAEGQPTWYDMTVDPGGRARWTARDERGLMRAMPTVPRLVPLLLLAASACGDKATAEDCRRAYEHVVDLMKKSGEVSQEQYLDLAIEHCTEKFSKEEVDCLLALAEYETMKLHDCHRPRLDQERAKKK